MEYREYWDHIYQKSDELSSLISSYWSDYSHLGTWQFWVVLSFMVAPLIILYFAVDRKRIFEIFFFGYTVHMLWTYIDIALSREGYFVHTYFLTPLLPFALSMTASALPVGFSLVYQYCTNHKKSLFLFTVLLSAIFAFGFATMEELMELIEIRKGMNKFFLFLLDIVVVYIAFWLTKLILKMRSIHK